MSFMNNLKSIRLDSFHKKSILALTIKIKNDCLDFQDSSRFQYQYN